MRITGFQKHPFFSTAPRERRGVFPYLPEDSFSPRALRGAFAPMRRPGAAPLAAVVLALAQPATLPVTSLVCVLAAAALITTPFC